MTSKRKYIAAISKNTVGLLYENLPKVSDNEVKLKSIYSAISSGTETKTLKKEVPSFSRHWDKEKRIFTKKGDVKKFPAGLGYSVIAEVLEVGKKVNDLKVGNYVWTDTPHSDFNIIDSERAAKYVLPENVDLKEVSLLPFVRIALGGIHDSRVKVGDTLVVIGLGLIGNLICQIGKIAGANVIAFDIDTSRVLHAKKIGINAVENKNVDIADYTRKYFPNGADNAIEASGTYEGLNEAVRAVGVTGRVTTVGSYPSIKAAMYLGEEWQKNKVQMVSSMFVNDCPHPNFPLWDLERLNKAALDLLTEKQIIVNDILETFDFKNYIEAYKKILSKKSKPVVVFKY